MQQDFDSEVPNTVDDLCCTFARSLLHIDAHNFIEVALPGVGPKMAFLALQVNIFGVLKLRQVD